MKKLISSNERKSCWRLVDIIAYLPDSPDRLATAVQQVTGRAVSEPHKRGVTKSSGYGATLPQGNGRTPA